MSKEIPYFDNLTHWNSNVIIVNSFVQVYINVFAY